MSKTLIYAAEIVKLEAKKTNMAPTVILDEYYFALCAIITVVMQLSCYFIAFTCNIDKITDFAGSTNFILLGVLTLVLKGSFYTRQIVITGLICLTRAELAAFLLYRVLKRKKDARFDEIRGNCLYFLGFWIYQILWVYLCMLPVIFLNGESQDAPLGTLDYISWACFGVGFFIQVIADMQKYRFRANLANKGSFCDVGLWSMSRHPNYYGEIIMWWAIFCGTIPVFGVTGNSVAAWCGIISPLFTMGVLLGLTGLPTAEGANLQRYYKNPDVAAEWERYRENASPIILLPQTVYRKLPMGLKRAFCCEFRFLEYTRPGSEDITEATPI